MNSCIQIVHNMPIININNEEDKKKWNNYWTITAHSFQNMESKTLPTNFLLLALVYAKIIHSLYVIIAFHASLCSKACWSVVKYFPSTNVFSHDLPHPNSLYFVTSK